MIMSSFNDFTSKMIQDHEALQVLGQALRLLHGFNNFTMTLSVDMLKSDLTPLTELLGH